jgi:hypothetical protein
MQDREQSVVPGVFLVLLVAWLGFLVHRSPRFPGSALGAAFGIAGAVVMLVPLAYVPVKRIPTLRGVVTKHVSLPTLLSWHVYAGLLGPLLAIIHTGHKFDSVLGSALTATMMLLVVTGFVGHWLFSYVRHELHEKRSMLVRLRTELDRARPQVEPGTLTRAGVLSLVPWGTVRGDPAARVLRLAAATADVEFAIGRRALLERWFQRWLWLHIVLSIAFYALLAMHVWAEVYYGLRWLR